MYLALSFRMPFNCFLFHLVIFLAFLSMPFSVPIGRMSLEVPQRVSPRAARQLKTAVSESDSVSSSSQASRTPKERSPKVVERLSPRSPASSEVFHCGIHYAIVLWHLYRLLSHFEFSFTTSIYDHALIPCSYFVAEKASASNICVGVSDSAASRGSKESQG